MYSCMQFLPYGFFVVIHFMANFKDIDLLISFWFLLAASLLTEDKVPWENQDFPLKQILHTATQIPTSLSAASAFTALNV